MNSFRISSVWAAAGLLFAASSASASSILGSKHNLSTSGPGPIQASGESEICIFCHAPHRASATAPLWNRDDSSAPYTPYSSGTLKASPLPGQPTGASKLCLSCHDGTMALGAVRSRPATIPFADGVVKMPQGRAAYLGTDLSDDHPVSFRYDQSLADNNGNLRSPATLLGPVRLDRDGQLQCTACHDPHNDQYGNFLVQPNAGAALCSVCHTLDTGGIHTCDSCHMPHNAVGHEWLLRASTGNNTCLLCHGIGGTALDASGGAGKVPAGRQTRNIGAELLKTSAHGDIRRNTVIHSPNEDPLNSPRHVECSDCHNPHTTAARAALDAEGAAAPSGLLGIDAAGNVVRSSAFLYEICFRCHADSRARGPARLRRQFPQTNTRLAFAAANASYHPVLAEGRNRDVPSLMAPRTPSSTIGCTDCHNNDEGPGANGTGPRGPHGSRYAPLLERKQVFTDFSAEGGDTYALCYKCHSRSSILGNESFGGHRKHVADVKAACTTCHDPHGVSGVAHLINFNLDYVSPNDRGQLEYVDTGRFQGTCSLTCHQHNHDRAAYGTLVKTAP